MKGFFGILNLKKDDFQIATANYLQNKSKSNLIFPLETDDILLIDFNSSVIKDAESENLYYVGWCRLDNITELQSLLNLKSNAIESEVILTAFKKWGEACVKHLIGDFSFAIWDSKKKTLFLAKDQMGIRPLFYMEQNGLFYFGTSIPEIKIALVEKPQLNEIYIAKELRNFPQDVADTFFKEIKRLKPAHCIMLHRDGIPLEERYWELSTINLSHCKNEEDYLELLRTALQEAVLCRIRDKKNIGCQLSGGMDSSAIAVLLSRLMDKKNLHTYSFVLDELTKTFSDNGIDEKETQEEIIIYANLIRENHHHITTFHYKNVFEEFAKKKTEQKLIIH